MIARWITACFMWLSTKGCYKDHSPEDVFWNAYRWFAFLCMFILCISAGLVTSSLNGQAGDVAIVVFITLIGWLMLYVFAPTAECRGRFRWYKRFGNNTIVYPCGSIQDGILLESKGTDSFVYLWNWDPRIAGNYELVPYSSMSKRIDLKMSPVTANPKVLNLVIHATMKMANSIPACIYFWAMYDHSTDWAKKLEADIEKWLSDQLYRLNATESQRLSQFLIPTDPEQQEAVSQVVRDFLRPNIPQKWTEFLKEPEVSFSIPILTAT